MPESSRLLPGDMRITDEHDERRGFDGVNMWTALDIAGDVRPLDRGSADSPRVQWIPSFRSGS